MPASVRCRTELIATCVRQRTDISIEAHQYDSVAKAEMRCTRTCFNTSSNKKAPMNITLTLVPIVSLIAGIMILVVPRLLSTIVAIYLIAVGLVGLFGAGHFLR